MFIIVLIEPALSTPNLISTHIGYNNQLLNEIMIYDFYVFNLQNIKYRLIKIKFIYLELFNSKCFL